MVDEPEDDFDFDFPSLDDEDDADATLGTIADPSTPPSPEPEFTPPTTAEEAIERMRADGDADPEGTARMNYPDLFPATEPEPKKPAQEPRRMGDNSGVQADQLRAFIERIERLEEDKKAVAEDIKQVYAEAKGTGYSTKTMRKVIALRKKDKAERDEEQSQLDIYLWALGMAD